MLARSAAAMMKHEGRREHPLRLQQRRVRRDCALSQIIRDDSLQVRPQAAHHPRGRGASKPAQDYQHQRRDEQLSIPEAR